MADGDYDSIFGNLPPMDMRPLSYYGPLSSIQATPELRSQLTNRPLVGPAANESPYTGMSPQELQSRLDFAQSQVDKYSKWLATKDNDWVRGQLQMNSEDMQNIREQLKAIGPRAVPSAPGSGLPLTAPQLVAHPGYGGLTNLEQHLQHLHDAGILPGGSE